MKVMGKKWKSGAFKMICTMSGNTRLMLTTGSEIMGFSVKTKSVRASIY